ncbi:hypothetical protein [Loigolactobacillus jiayinensis]|uniref:Uncharacterized protein n=1 Tax=Loigolactobacillus jiayinensis TaxID=2486016 RepID=A0ABW1RHL7_9LACO|nr:hypothetical protein [Loigolactobacillus jiayinensis]
MGQSYYSALFFFVFYLILLIAVALGQNMLAMYMMASGMLLNAGIALMRSRKRK